MLTELAAVIGSQRAPQVCRQAAQPATDCLDDRCAAAIGNLDGYQVPADPLHQRHDSPARSQERVTLPVAGLYPLFDFLRTFVDRDAAYDAGTAVAAAFAALPVPAPQEAVKLTAGVEVALDVSIDRLMA